MVRLFYYLSILNVFDAIITFIGLELSLIQEMNPIMNHIYQTNPVLFLLIKFTLSFCLYLFIILKKVPKSTSSRILTYFASGFYTIIFFVHCFWISTVFVNTY
ncbi:DUF5658 family protein [Neobacillus sp. LXY-4]|uniref:DUF5658 family protein n=1 Tax=Neobacillus sp. LXY-4 TaxID=3379826 RepID=UPI003EE12520